MRRQRAWINSGRRASGLRVGAPLFALSDTATERTIGRATFLAVLRRRLRGTLRAVLVQLRDRFCGGDALAILRLARHDAP